MGESEHELSVRLRAMWAKSDDEDRSLSLVSHAADAAAVAGYLWDHWLPRSVRDLLSGGRSDDEMLAMARWLAGVHDVGKVSPAFACQVGALAGAICETGLKIAADKFEKRTPHSVISHHAIEKYLIEERDWKRIPNARSYAVVAGGHHGVPPVSLNLRSLRADVRMLGDAHWDEVRTEFLDFVARISGAERFLDKWKTQPLTPQQQALWTAVVIIADWLASDAHRFPLQEHRNAEEFAAGALAELALPPPWNAAAPQNVETVFSRFGLPAGAHPNSVQAAALRAAATLGPGGLIIVEAATGTGKTEAALMAAEQFASSGGWGGVYVALPTMATANAMFSRMLTWMRAIPGTGPTSVVLAHGKAELNDVYRGMVPMAALADIESDCGEGHVAVAHQWLSGRKKSLLASFGVGTIDQLLFMALKSRYVVLRHLAFAGKVVIVDEVHAADAFMREYLKRALEWLGAYGVPVILLSATLPRQQRVEYTDAYVAGRSEALHGDEVASVGYPAIVSVGLDGKVTVAQPESPAAPQDVAIRRLDDSSEALVEFLADALSEGGCAAVVRNTVGRAQEAARALRKRFGSDVVLLHSAFIAQDRADQELQLLDELGRDGSRPTRRIVVATQIIEQSLDCDFDLMVSDLAPIDLLFQRMGRLHRHPRTRLGGLGEARFGITGVKDWTESVPRPIEVSAKVYERFHLMRALAVLRSRESITRPADISLLVQAAYADDIDAPAEWQEILAEDERAARRRAAASANRADEFRLRPVRGTETLVGLLAYQGSEPDDARGYARVREGNDSIEVVVTQRDGDKVRLPKRPGSETVGPLITTKSEPADRIARMALASTIRLPFSLSHPGVAENVIAELERRTYGYEGWRTSKWLKGELALELDHNLEATLLNKRVRYRTDDGLIVEGVE